MPKTQCFRHARWNLTFQSSQRRSGWGKNNGDFPSSPNELIGDSDWIPSENMREWQSRGIMENKDTQILKLSRKEVLSFLTISVCFAAVFIYMIVTGFQSWLIFLVLINAVLFPLGCIFLLFHTPCLIIKPEGFIVKTFFFQRKMYRWADIQRFEVASRGGLTPGSVAVSRLVGFCFSEGYAKNPLREFTRWANGCDAIIPFHYGMDPKEMANLLNKKRAEYLGLKQ